MFQIALPLENTDRGQNRVVGQSRFLSNRIKHLLDRARPLPPEHVHDPQLGFGQSSRLSRRHRRPSSNLRRITKRKVTNSLVAREKSRVAWRVGDFNAPSNGDQRVLPFTPPSARCDIGTLFQSCLPGGNFVIGRGAGALPACTTSAGGAPFLRVLCARVGTTLIGQWAARGFAIGSWTPRQNAGRLFQT